VFVAGLAVGPALGLLIGNVLPEVAGLDRRIMIALVAIALALNLVISYASLDIRLGITVGCALGLLVSGTPDATPLDVDAA